MSEKRGKRKRGGEEGIELESEKKRKTKRGKKEKEEEDDVVVIEDDNVDDERDREGKEERERRSEDVLGKREQEEERERERERAEVVMKRRRKEEEEKKKRFECGICLELMNWEKEPRLLPCCGLSFCSLCLNKLLLLQNPSSSSSSSSLKGVKCPVCGEVNECESVETLSMNYLIPETIDVLLSSNLITFSHQPGFLSFFFELSLFFLSFFERKVISKLKKHVF